MKFVEFRKSPAAFCGYRGYVFFSDVLLNLDSRVDRMFSSRGEVPGGFSEAGHVFWTSAFRVCTSDSGSFFLVLASSRFFFFPERSFRCSVGKGVVPFCPGVGGLMSFPLSSHIEPLFSYALIPKYFFASVRDEGGPG